MLEYMHISVLVSVFALASLAEARFPARRAIHDDKRLLLNFGLGLLAVLVSLLPWIGPVSAAMLSASSDWGMLRQNSTLELPLPVEAALALCLFSLASYGLHRLMHRSDLLWHWHRVHHQDAQLDFSTGFRNHPLEVLLTSVALAVVTGLIGFGPMAVTGALVALQALDLAAHSNVSLPPKVEELLGRVVVTPAMHSRHHSANRIEHDSNYGNGLIIWDRLFGTFSGSQSPERLGQD